LSRAGRVAVLLGVAGSLVTGCALFSDLNGTEWTLADGGGPDAGCLVGDAGDGGDGGDSGCSPLLPRACDCSSGQICCLSTNSGSVPSISCQSSPSCSTLGTAFQLCNTTAECTSGGTCTAQQCSVAGFTGTVGACAMIPMCTTQ
jgi:hypothetical protein